MLGDNKSHMEGEGPTEAADVPPYHANSNFVYESRLESELKDLRQIIVNKDKVIAKKQKLITSLRLKCAELEASHREMKNDSDLLKIVNSMFSVKQIQFMKNRHSFVHWSEVDIAKAIALDSISTTCLTAPWNQKL